MSEENPYHLALEDRDRIESLYARVAALEARVAELSSSVKPFRVTPEGIDDMKKQIEEPNHEDYHYTTYKEIVINDLYIEKGAGPAMFAKIYHRIPKMTSLQSLRMVSGNGNPLDSGLSLLPDLTQIRNCSVKEMRICAGFDFIPYLENFPSLLRLEIVPHPLRPLLNNNEEKRQKIYEYCKANGITVLC